MCVVCVVCVGERCVCGRFDMVVCVCGWEGKVDALYKIGEGLNCILFLWIIPQCSCALTHLILLCTLIIINFIILLYFALSISISN